MVVTWQYNSDQSVVCRSSAGTGLLPPTSLSGINLEPSENKATQSVFFTTLENILFNYCVAISFNYYIVIRTLRQSKMIL